jgi:glutathione S-transferase
MTYPANFTEPTGTPFGIKVMCLFKMAKLDWEPEFVSDPRKAPNAKFPVLDDEGTIVPDSDTIRSYLEKKHDLDFDEGLNKQQRAVSRALIRMVEEHLYFAIIYDRWKNEDNWVLVKKAFFGHMPFFLFPLITRAVHKHSMASLNGQGLGRHNYDEMLAKAGKDIQAVKDFLGDQHYLFGDKPTAADASVIPILRTIATSPASSKLKDLIIKDTGLMAYLDRGKKELYPEY